MRIHPFVELTMATLSAVNTLLSADNLAFIQKGISISVASRDVRLVPSLSRGLACRLSDCGQQLRVSVARSQCHDLLRDLEKTHAIAVVFTEPTTHRTLQIKGSDATLAEVQEADRETLDASGEAFAAEILPLGFDAAYTRRLFFVAPEDLVVVAFTPEAVFQQTPGPHAGDPLEPAP